MHIHSDCLASTKLYYLMTQAQLLVIELPRVVRIKNRSKHNQKANIIHKPLKPDRQTDKQRNKETERQRDTWMQRAYSHWTVGHFPQVAKPVVFQHKLQTHTSMTDVHKWDVNALTHTVKLKMTGLLSTAGLIL